MAVTIDVDYRLLARSVGEWGTQAATLDAAQLRMAKVDGAGLPADVAAEVKAFATRWQAEIHRLATLAQDNADALSATVLDYRIADLGRAETLRGLLPWSECHDPIRAV